MVLQTQKLVLKLFVGMLSKPKALWAYKFTLDFKDSITWNQVSFLFRFRISILATYILQGRPSQNGYFQSHIFGRIFKFLHDFLPCISSLEMEFL